MTPGPPTNSILMSTGNLARRRLAGRCFSFLVAGCAYCTIAILAVLIIQILGKGFPLLTWDFISSFPSRKAEDAGIKAALWGTFWLMSLTMAIATPVGIAAAIYLEEFARKGKLSTFIEVNISNLAGVPSIIYGILGLALFVRAFQLDRSLIAGALTMALLILPVVIISAREAIRSVPSSLREASFGLGATRWQTTWNVVLPSAFPGIMTGLILSTSRAIGETAPLIMIGALTYIAFTPRGPMDAYTAMPIQVYDWASRPQPEFQVNAAAGIVVLMAILLMLNGVAIWLRHRSSKKAH